MVGHAREQGEYMGPNERSPHFYDESQVMVQLVSSRLIYTDIGCIVTDGISIFKGNEHTFDRQNFAYSWLRNYMSLSGQDGSIARDIRT